MAAYPQFRIAWLLLFTAFAAVTLAGFIDPLSFWSRIQFYLWCLFLLRAAVVAVADGGRRAKFARGFVLFVLVYLTAAYLEHPGNHAPFLPHTWLLRVADDHLVEDRYEAYQNCRRSLLVIVSIAWGLVGGFLTWRREVDPPSVPA